MRARTFFGLFSAGFFLTTIDAAELDVSRLPRPFGGAVVFEKDIKPILERSCFQCHGATRPKGRFRMDSRDAMLKGGESEQAAIIPGKSASSPLVQYVAGLTKEMEMPPLEKRDKYPALTEIEIGLLRAWIDQGANWPKG